MLTRLDQQLVLILEQLLHLLRFQIETALKCQKKELSCVLRLGHIFHQRDSCLLLLLLLLLLPQHLLLSLLALSLKQLLFLKVLLVPLSDLLDGRRHFIALLG